MRQKGNRIEEESLLAAGALATYSAGELTKTPEVLCAHQRWWERKQDYILNSKYVWFSQIYALGSVLGSLSSQSNEQARNAGEMFYAFIDDQDSTQANPDNLASTGIGSLLQSDLDHFPLQLIYCSSSEPNNPEQRGQRFSTSFSWLSKAQCASLCSLLIFLPYH